MKNILKNLYEFGIIPVVSVSNLSDAEPLAEALCGALLPIAEVTFRTDCAAGAIAAMKTAYPDMLLGAGTVLNPAQAAAARDAGAEFIVSPGFSSGVAEFCGGCGLTYIPGCSNATDITAAVSFGIKTVKFFPAEASGGINALKALSAPFGGVKFVPTGGIGEDRLCDYLALNAVTACGGTFIAPNKLIEGGRFDEIKENARHAQAVLHGFSIGHIGIYAGGESGLQQTAASLASLTGCGIRKAGDNAVFVGDEFELIGSDGQRMPHVALRVNNGDRAAAYLTRMGITFDEDTKQYDKNGILRSVYLKHEIAGMRFHIAGINGN